MDVAYTLQVGRDPMGERLGFLVGSLDELAAKLHAWLAGEPAVEGTYQGQVKRHKEGLKLITQDDEMRALLVDKWLRERKLAMLLDLWVKGLDLDWNQLYGAAKPQRIELPGYPFAKEPYRLAAAPSRQEGPAAAPGAPEARTVHEPAAPTPRLPASQDKLGYVHDWVEQPPLAAHAAAATHKTVLIVQTASCWGLESAIRAHHATDRGCRVVLIRLGDETRALSEDEWSCGVGDAEGLRACLQGLDRIDALYFLASNDGAADPASSAALHACQERNEIQLLRLVKCLKQDRKVDARVDTYVLTVDNHPIGRRPARYWGAGASGLAYSLAQGNHQFRVRNLDLSSRTWTMPSGAPR